ncbi:sigma-54 dependent transcriptional regulator [Desulfovibrio mangrovi]|uniref:sigma-54-dependent transcriptional regulator n=1 Tax=Desulfovibrio mangrovi TaxID=2976983 RepID=UPI002247F104|nr:sigma-54 dependent transcriptional regulator [Desulfovibrio mangrovi]UZP65877.1 sigma-54 dependent transcriptional regulator [Desulfovibrio mangrovi]
MARILIIEDDVLFREMLTSAMQLEGHEVEGASSMAQGRVAFAGPAFDLVLLDVGLPDGNGLRFISEISSAEGAPEVIIITGDGHADGAELAISSGALDYISKPASLASVHQAVDRALTYRQGARQLSEPERFGIVGNSVSMQRCFRLLAEAASSDAPVLITGETGTGKELFARAVHRNSQRVSGPFVAVDCGAIAKSLTESELFGHAKGAFTGADRPRDGLVLQAHGGTLFLDEVGELAMPQQRAFLRVLEEQRFRPVGGGHEIFSNFRLVAATNRPLPAMVHRGTFRADLLYRLQAVHIHLPPLRERMEDLPELVTHFIEKGCQRYGFQPKTLNVAFVNELKTYPWPGNVRELLHVTEQSIIRGRFSDELLPEHLPSSIRVAVARSRIMNTGQVAESEYLQKHGDDSHESGKDWRGSENRGQTQERNWAKASSNARDTFAAESEAGVLSPWKEFRDKVLDDAERSYLLRLLHSTQGDVTRASGIAGISRQRLYAMLRKHGISKSWRFETEL